MQTVQTKLTEIICLSDLINHFNQCYGYLSKISVIVWNDGAWKKKINDRMPMNNFIWNLLKDHEELSERLRKTLYYGKQPTTDRPSLPLTSKSLLSQQITKNLNISAIWNVYYSVKNRTAQVSNWFAKY